MSSSEEVTVKVPQKLEVTLIHEYRVESKTMEFIKELLPQVIDKVREVIEDIEKKEARRWVRIRTPETGAVGPMSIPPIPDRSIIDVPEVEEYLVKEAKVTMEELATYRKITNAVKEFFTKKMKEEASK